ncbi:SAM-dependent methyltransferase [Streptomyces sp. 35G-GA-8]
MDAERPPEFHSDVARPARVYDAWLGGTHHFPADQEAAEPAAVDRA